MADAAGKPSLALAQSGAHSCRHLLYRVLAGIQHSRHKVVQVQPQQVQAGVLDAAVRRWHPDCVTHSAGAAANRVAAAVVQDLCEVAEGSDN